MKLAMIGLGRMGGSMTEHLLRAGHAVVASAPDAAAVAEAEKRGAIGAHSVEEVVRKLEPPRVVWLMIPVGPPVEETINALRPLLARGDIIVDGGNSGFTDSVRRAGELAAAGIGFLDAGTSGGVWGLKDGYCLMIGGEAEHVLKVEPIFKALAPPDGYAHVGRAGAGHYAKMIHNAIEYAMLQAYGEGFAMLEASDFDLDLPRIAALWTHGAVGGPGSSTSWPPTPFPGADHDLLDLERGVDHAEPARPRQHVLLDLFQLADRHRQDVVAEPLGQFPPIGLRIHPRIAHEDGAPERTGNPSRVRARPTTTCGSPSRRSLLCPRLRSGGSVVPRRVWACSSSSSISKYTLVVSQKMRSTSALNRSAVRKKTSRSRASRWVSRKSSARYS